MSLEPDIAAKQPNMLKIFLSYARDDSAKAQSLVKALEADGFAVWWDGLISGGHAFAERIDQALADADVVLVLWSKHSVHSHWVRDEAGFGRDRNRMVPVSIDDSQPPLGFRQIQSIDLSHWRGNARAREYSALSRSIRSVAGLPETKGSLPSIQSAWPRRQVLAAAGAIAVAGFGAGAFWLRGGQPAEAASIAVLPFRNLGGEAADSYFSDGLAEELRATLSRIRQLAVAAQTSSDNFRDGKAGARDVAKALGVAFLLDGSVRRSRDLVRVSTRIVDGRTGFDNWSQSFDRSSTDSLSIQSAIAAFVTDALLAGLAKDQRPSERLGGTRNQKAFDAFLRGAALYRSAGGKEADLGALAAFNEAIASDRNYAVAHAARARALTVIANNYAAAGEIPAYYQGSVDAARRAIEIAADMAEGHSALGFALFNGQLDARAAEAPYQRSFELGYGNAEILSAYANFAGRTGRFDDGRAAINRAQRLDPLNPAVFRNGGLLEYAARDYDAAESPLRTALSLNPNARITHSALGDVAVMRGDAEAARMLYAKEPDEVSRWRGVAIAESKLGHVAAAEQAYAKLVEAGAGIIHYQQAQVMAQWGKRDEAIEFLERALVLRDAGLVRIKNDPLLDPLRPDSRFAAIERKIGFS